MDSWARWSSANRAPKQALVAGRVQSTSRVAIVRRGREARLWTRNRNDITDRFPDIADAAIHQVPDGVVLDGELVILGADGRLSFDGLQQRLVTSPAKARAKAAELPASYAASVASGLTPRDARVGTDGQLFNPRA
jgi:hypothetical protein